MIILLSNYFILCIMISYINCTVDINLHPTIEAREIHVREMIDEIRSQLEAFDENVEAVVQINPGHFRLTAKSSRKLEIVENTDFYCAVTPSPSNLFPQLSGSIFRGCLMGCPMQKLLKFLNRMAKFALLRARCTLGCTQG